MLTRMPEMHTYICTQVRKVRVTANSAADAVKIADAGFTKGQNAGGGVIEGPHGIWGNTEGRIEILSLKAEKIR